MLHASYLYVGYDVGLSGCFLLFYVCGWSSGPKCTSSGALCLWVGSAGVVRSDLPAFAVLALLLRAASMGLVGLV